MVMCLLTNHIQGPCAPENRTLTLGPRHSRARKHTNQNPTRDKAPPLCLLHMPLSLVVVVMHQMESLQVPPWIFWCYHPPYHCYYHSETKMIRTRQSLEVQNGVGAEMMRLLTAARQAMPQPTRPAPRRAQDVSCLLLVICGRQREMCLRLGNNEKGAPWSRQFHRNNNEKETMTRRALMGALLTLGIGMPGRRTKNKHDVSSV